MRRLITFACEGEQLGASVDGTSGTLGLLIVTGGAQTRIGSHRLFERLAKALSDDDYPCFRFDRRGVGDSSGADPDFRGNAQDIAAAMSAFRAHCPRLERIVGFGLCDGATSLALHGAGSGLAGLLLVNPWLVEAESDAPPPAAIRHHYRKRLLSLDGWKKLLSGSVSYGKLLRGIRKIAAPVHPANLALDVASGLAAAGLPVELILARNDATAVAAADAWRSPSFAKHIAGLHARVTTIDTDAHTFSRPGDLPVLLDTCRIALGRLAAYKV